MSDESLQALASLAREWVNILSINELSDGRITVAIEYTVPPDPSFKQSQYKTATRWVKYVGVFQPSILRDRATLANVVLNIARNVREALDDGVAE